MAESRGLSKGREAGKTEIIRQAHRAGISAEKIASMFELELDKVESIVANEGN